MDRWHEAGLLKPRGGEGYTTAGRNNDLTRAGIKAKTDFFPSANVCSAWILLDYRTHGKQKRHPEQVSSTTHIHRNSTLPQKHLSSTHRAMQRTCKHSNPELLGSESTVLTTAPPSHPGEHSVALH